MTKYKATVLQQQAVELPRRAQSQEDERCLPDPVVSLLCFALLCFALLSSLPPSSLAMRTVRTITAPDGVDLNFTWEVKCWVRKRESFYCYAVA